MLGPGIAGKAWWFPYSAPENARLRLARYPHPRSRKVDSLRFPACSCAIAVPPETNTGPVKPAITIRWEPVLLPAVLRRKQQTGHKRPTATTIDALPATRVVQSMPILPGFPEWQRGDQNCCACLPDHKLCKSSAPHQVFKVPLVDGMASFALGSISIAWRNARATDLKQVSAM